MWGIEKETWTCDKRKEIKRRKHFERDIICMCNGEVREVKDKI